MRNPRAIPPLAASRSAKAHRPITLYPQSTNITSPANGVFVQWFHLYGPREIGRDVLGRVARSKPLAVAVDGIYGRTSRRGVSATMNATLSGEDTVDGSEDEPIH